MLFRFNDCAVRWTQDIIQNEQRPDDVLLGENRTCPGALEMGEEAIIGLSGLDGREASVAEGSKGSAVRRTTRKPKWPHTDRVSTSCGLQLDHLVLMFDGASKGNPGPAGAGPCCMARPQRGSE